MNEIISNEAYEQAYTLHRRIVVNAQSAQDSLFEVCKGLKEMRDKELFKELGYENFKDYSSAELGMTSRNANRYISIAEMVEKSGTSMSPNIGTTRLYLLSTLAEDDRKEVAESTDLEHISVRDLQKKIDELKAEKETAAQEAEAAKRKESKAFEQLSIVKTDSEMLSKKVQELQAELKELEARPVEVAVENDPEAEKQLAEKEQQLKELQKQLKDVKKSLKDEKQASASAMQEALDKQAAEHKSETDRLTAEMAELERQLAVKPKEIRVTVDEDKVTFKIKLSTAYEALMPAAQFAAASENEEFKVKLIALLDAARKIVEKE